MRVKVNATERDLNIPLKFSSIFVDFCAHLISTILFQHSEHYAAKLPAKRSNRQSINLFSPLAW